MSVSDIWNRLSSKEDEKCAIYYDTPLACTDNIIKIDDISMSRAVVHFIYLDSRSKEESWIKRNKKKN